VKEQTDPQQSEKKVFSGTGRETIQTGIDILTW